jgi:hypothetical protein
MQFWVKEGKSGSKLVSVVWCLVACICGLSASSFDSIGSSGGPIPADLLLD